jgi:hypothetical protein
MKTVSSKSSFQFPVIAQSGGGFYWKLETGNWKLPS